MALNLPTALQKYIDLVRRLETSSYIFDGDPAVIDKNLRDNAGGSFSSKLLIRTDALDPTHKLLRVLTRTDFTIKWVGRGWAIAYGVMGFVGVIGLLNMPVLNFFYVLAALLGWHTITLVLWLIGLRARQHYAFLDMIFERLQPTELAQKYAFNIHLESITPVQKWYVGMLMHRSWLAGLIGSLLGLLLMFLFKSYAFLWESTLLSQSHFASIIGGLAFIPSLFGFSLPTDSQLAAGGGADKLATLMMLSVLLYAFIPRLCAFLYCKAKAKNDFQIDTSLYYYENLHRKIMTKVVNINDFTPPSLKKPAQTKPTAHQKIAVLLEREYNETTWQAFCSRADVHNLGVIDTRDDMDKLAKAITNHKAQICLGIACHALPDRGIVKKLDTIIQMASYGIRAELLINLWHENDYTEQWQTVLAERGIEVVKFEQI
ncbi:MAG: DUF2868 domain-containing protein [Moraxella sp.]|nr:DUF2868 domain-containing protein [Moraxella sp.]